MKLSNLIDKAKRTRARRSKLLKIVYRPVEELKPDPANPRRHSKKQIGQIANSIRAFDFNVPILIDRDNKVIAGHGRLFACRELGITDVPTLCLDHLTPAQVSAFMIADNQLTVNASWDDRLLAEQLKDLSLLGLDFTLEVTGFEMGEIDLRIVSLEDSPDPADDPTDALPELPEGPPLSRRGVCGFSVAIASCAVTLSTPPTS
jgi:ParB-like chromosome segregation protein Spo0J